MEKFRIYKRILSGGRNINKDGESKIYIEVIKEDENFKRTTKRIDTTVRVKPKNWDTKRSQIKPSDERFDMKNDVVNRKFLFVQNELEGLKNGIQTDIPLVHFPATKKGLTGYIDDYVKYRQSIGSPRGTVKEFITCKNRVSAYENAIDIKVGIDDCNLLFADKFHSFLQSAGYKTGTIHKTFSILRTILYYFYDRQSELNIKMNDKFKAKSWKRGDPSKNEPNPLTKEQFSHLYNYNFANDRLNQMRDRFIFQCTTGARYSDAFLITRANIKNELINYKPVKTVHKKDNIVQVPLNAISREILEKYNWDMTALKITNQKYNQGLKEMFEILISKSPDIFDVRRTSHNGRDTFITVAIQNGAPNASILRWVGQSSYSEMDKYYKLFDNVSVKTMGRLKEFAEIKIDFDEYAKSI